MLKILNKLIASILFVCSVLLHGIIGWSGSMLFVVASIIITIIFWCGIKLSESLFSVAFLFSVLMLQYPVWYEYAYPNHNLEEDLVREAHDVKSICLLFIISVGVVILLYLLNQFYLKKNDIWILNTVISVLIACVGFGSMMICPIALFIVVIITRR